MDDTPAEQGLEAENQHPAAKATAAPDVDPRIREEGETPETPEEPGAKPAEKPDGIQKRIDELTRKRHEAERKAAYWEGKATAGQPVSKPETDPLDAKPKQESYQSYEEYIEAVTDWKLTARFAERTRIQQEAHQQTVQKGFEAQVKSAREKHADFDHVVYNPDLRISETMREFVLKSEYGASIAYDDLGKHPEEAARIANLPEDEQIIEMGALVGMRRLQAKLDAKSTPTAPVPSNAPAPITPVKASAPSTTGLRDDLSVGDWMKRRNADLRKR